MLFELCFPVLQTSDLSFVDRLETTTRMQSLPVVYLALTQIKKRNIGETDSSYQVYSTMPLLYDKKVYYPHLKRTDTMCTELYLKAIHTYVFSI